MKLRRVYPVAVAVALILASQASFAQFESSDKSRVGITMSVMMPTGSKLKNINDIWLGPILEVNIAHDRYDRPIAVASVGWFAEETGQSRCTLVPLRLTYFKRFGDEYGSRWYVGSGVSAYFANYKAIEYNPFTRSDQFVENDGTPLGVSFVAGTELGKAWFGEFRYDLVDSLSLPTGSSVDFSGISVNFGTRMAF